MKCEHVRDELVALVQGELDAGRARAVRSHLSSCSACIEEKATVEMLFGLVAQVPDEAPSQQFDQAFEKKLDEARQRRASRIASALERSELGWLPPTKQIIRERVENAPMLAVSAALHVLVIAFLGLLIYAGTRGDDATTAEQIELPEEVRPPDTAVEDAREEWVRKLPQDDGPRDVRVELAWQPQRARGRETLTRLGLERTIPAIERGIAWLAESQQADGGWGGVGPTALATQAMLAEGNTTSGGVHRASVGRALQHLRRRQQPDGLFVDAGAQTADLRAHALAVQALGEHLLLERGPGKRPKSDDPTGDYARLRLAAGALLGAQSAGGGWGHAPGAASAHAEATSWILFLHPLLRELGMALPKIVIDRALGALTALTDDEGRVGYARKGDASRGLFGATSLALLARQAVQPAKAGIEAGKQILATALSSLQRAQAEPWLWHHSSLALMRARAPQAGAWQRSLRAVLLGRLSSGSWSPDGSVGPFSGRAAGTALAVLSLQVHYRYQ